ncbi:MAG: hypothetical protein NC396_01740 [Bacteroides sp.]|nr:hypothetical protein [Bacteroides sp.]MCM1085562.1 hypothetical protein [Bacteroides sp.]
MKHRKPHTKPKLTAAQKEAVYALPLSQQFRIVHIDPCSGQAVYQHELVDETARDYRQVLTVAKAYARETVCAINPEVKPQAEAARQKIFPGIEGFVNPDLTVEKYGYVDVKSPLSKAKIVRNANAANKQHAIAAITDLALENGELTVTEVEKFTDRIFSSQNSDDSGALNYTMNEVHWYVKGVLLKCNRPEKN